MDLESQLVNALYNKLGGCSLRNAVRLQDGSLAICGRVTKTQLKRAIRSGGADSLIDLLIADPSRLGKYGTKSVRDGLRSLAQSSISDGSSLAEAFSAILRSNEVRGPKA